MGYVVCTLSQQTIVAIRRIDHDAIAGNFSMVDWQQLQLVADSIERMITETRLIDAGRIEIFQALRGVSTSNGIVPSVVLYSEDPIRSEEIDCLDALLISFVRGLLPEKSMEFRDDLYPETMPLIDMTAEQRSCIDRTSSECARSIGKNFKRPILFKNSVDSVVAIAEGKIRAPASQIVGAENVTRVMAVVDQLGYTNFLIRLVADNDSRIEGNYESHEDFMALAEIFHAREECEFEIVERIDDRGRSRNVVRLSSRSQ